MTFLKLLWMLATCCCRIRVDSAWVPATANNTGAAINLPTGFDSQMTPMNPLLYPFATAEMPPRAWPIPLMVNNATIQHAPPMLQDRILTAPSAPSKPEEEGIIGPALEAIVYGTWKPEQSPEMPVPVQHEQIFDLSRSDSDSDSVEDTKVAKDRIDDRLKAILSGQHDIPEQYNFPESRHAIGPTIETKDDGDYVKKPVTKKYGRQKIPAPNKHGSEIKTGSVGIEVINVNSSDPQLLAMVKQINHSAEITTALREEGKRGTNAAHSTWMPIAPTTAAIKTQTGSDESTNVVVTQDITTTAAPKNWPTDFEHTTRPASQLDYNFRGGDSTGPPQALSGGGFSIPDSLLPQMPYNITKMGIPYEHQNLSEEPTICVPLTVREESMTNTPGIAPELVNVERVYCFPLPAPAAHDDTEAKVNVLADFEEEAAPLPSAAGHINSIRRLGIFILVCLAFLKYQYPHPN